MRCYKNSDYMCSLTAYFSGLGGAMGFREASQFRFSATFINTGAATEVFLFPSGGLPLVFLFDLFLTFKLTMFFYI